MEKFLKNNYLHEWAAPMRLFNLSTNAAEFIRYLKCDPSWRTQKDTFEECEDIPIIPSLQVGVFPDISRYCQILPIFPDTAKFCRYFRILPNFADFGEVLKMSTLLISIPVQCKVFHAVPQTSIRFATWIENRGNSEKFAEKESERDHRVIRGKRYENGDR